MQAIWHMAVCTYCFRTGVMHFRHGVFQARRTALGCMHSSCKAILQAVLDQPQQPGASWHTATAFAHAVCREEDEDVARCADTNPIIMSLHTHPRNGPMLAWPAPAQYAAAKEGGSREGGEGGSGGAAGPPPSYEPPAWGGAPDG